MREKKCTKQFALNAKRNVKCHSSLMAADQYTAENVTLRKHPQEETDTRSSQQLYSKLSFLPFLYSFFKSPEQILAYANFVGWDKPLPLCVLTSNGHGDIGCL